MFSWIPSLIEIFGVHPKLRNFELFTTKFPTSTFFVYVGVSEYFTLQPVVLSKMSPN